MRLVDQKKKCKIDFRIVTEIVILYLSSKFSHFFDFDKINLWDTN